MLFAIHCLDKAGALDLRMTTRPTHIAYLEAHNDALLYGGPLLAEDGKTPVGSLLIVEAASLAEATAFAEADPYAKAGLFDTVAIRQTTRVFPKAVTA
jgi:uncharacterized protein